MAPLVTGSDVSHWQYASLAFAQARKAAGDRFAIYKSKDGLYNDPAAGAHYHNMTSVGMAVGTYIFYRSKIDPIAQAEGLLEAGQGLHLPFGWWLDYEGASGMDSADDLWRFMSTLDKGTDQTVGIYGQRDMLAATIGHDARFSRFPIWHPEYPGRYADGSTTPAEITVRAGAPWSRTPDVWQFTDSRKGLNGLDRNVCTEASFAAITGGHSTPNPEDLTMGDIKAITDHLAAIEAEQKRQGAQLDVLYNDYGVSVEPGHAGPDGKNRVNGSKRWQIGDMWTQVRALVRGLLPQKPK